MEKYDKEWWNSRESRAKENAKSRVKEPRKNRQRTEKRRQGAQSEGECEESKKAGLKNIKKTDKEQKREDKELTEEKITRWKFVCSTVLNIQGCRKRFVESIQHLYS